MRIIAGTFRSRQLKSTKGMALRPTSDKLRETLFNVLGELVVDARFVDLFAGTGAVGIEALSRGAVMVYFVECAKTAVALVHQNLQSLGITEGFQILQQESAHTISQLARQQIKPDYIFLDPPYRLREAYQKTLEILGSSNLSERALVIAEHEKRFDPGEKFGDLQRSRTLQQGDAALSFYRRAPDQKL